MKALLIEPNPHHYEVLPGFAHYFVELGFEVSLLVQEHGRWGDEFCRCPEFKQRLHIHTYETGSLEGTLRSLHAQECYDVLFFTSLDYDENGQPYGLSRRFADLEVDGTFICGCYHMAHSCEKQRDAAFARKRRVVSLTSVKTPEFEFVEVNPHFFCDEQRAHRKGDVTSIASIGVSVDGSALCSAANRVRAASRKDIKLSYVSRYTRWEAFVHNLKCLRRYARKLLFNEDYDKGWYSFWSVVLVPLGMRGRVTMLREAPFETMFDLVEQADFLACNISRQLGDEFSSGRTSGIRQLSLGFLTPCIIERRHADYYGFSDKNAIVYEQGMLKDAVRRAACMSSEEYDAMCRELDVLRRDVERRSLCNLSEMLR